MPAPIDAANGRPNTLVEVSHDEALDAARRGLFTAPTAVRVAARTPRSHRDEGCDPVEM